jgi:hypothetical protein
VVESQEILIMLRKVLSVVAPLLLLAALPLFVGCASDASGMASAPCDRPQKKSCGLCARLAGKCPEHARVHSTPAPVASVTAQDLPPNGVEGECYAKVFIPAVYKTVTERNLVKEASERLEIVPAEYKWVEERVQVKEASTQLVEVPAVYKWVERTVQVKPAHRGWVMEKKTRCAGDEKPRDVFCLVSTPAEFKTVRSQCLVTRACTREEIIPAEYSMVRRQVVATPAKTRRIAIPAEYADFERTVMVAEAVIKWEHIVCEDKITADTVNKIKSALVAAGYTPGPLDGQLAAADWTALTEFQKHNRIGVGELSYTTLKQLGVSMQ